MHIYTLIPSIASCLEELEGKKGEEKISNMKWRKSKLIKTTYDSIETKWDEIQDKNKEKSELNPLD